MKLPKIVPKVVPKVVIDTNVLIASLRSRRGASFRLLSLIGKNKFEFALSVPLVPEYEDIAFRQAKELGISAKAITAIIDRLCFYGNLHEIFFLWRPYLPDPKDDMVLEIAVSAQCDFIVSYNKRDFAGIGRFGLNIPTSKEFLEFIGEL
ncbi:MAG: putative toxin-antitoxin system toxin component, PIN family [Desulfococcaceae bacterium]|jgi:putative PIN family toxin of toxin-antitoxin system|nr:putative toxin-antitoxin system toxin component, PIN family [Desulfococcaceae bacterium]